MGEIGRNSIWWAISGELWIGYICGVMVVMASCMWWWWGICGVYGYDGGAGIYVKSCMWWCGM
jgi:hypothetical protein